MIPTLIPLGLKSHSQHGAASTWLMGYDQVRQCAAYAVAFDLFRVSLTSFPVQSFRKNQQKPFKVIYAAYQYLLAKFFCPIVEWKSAPVGSTWVSSGVQMF